ncbi:MAG: phosphoribosylformylglycinamidine cyclo-ligase [Oscillospiraceae bacterium]|nr:phosphoribosylformylglycinamidine cyclo-ligase [Oscillospiraceae bacterium]
MEQKNFTYSGSGVDITKTDAIKSEISGFVGAGNPRVLNGLGPFASLFDIKFDNIKHPVLVLKAEEPGSKQKLAAEYGYFESVCHDMINHLVNDIIVMGALPLAVLDTVVCGEADAGIIKKIIKGISEACIENECTLVGGETSVQPNVVDKGIYVLTSSIAGIVEKEDIIDGSTISEGDIIITLSSNGLHTNGYSLVRMLMDTMPEITKEKINGESFIEAVMKPHTAYYKSVKDLVSAKKIKGMAHITGGGIEGNLSRIIPDGLCASVDLAEIEVPPVFKFIKDKGNIPEEEMLKTFNCGAGLMIAAEKADADKIIAHISKYHNCKKTGEVIFGGQKIQFKNNLKF